jgi:hypothetical protein
VGVYVGLYGVLLGGDTGVHVLLRSVLSHSVECTDSMYGVYYLVYVSVYSPCMGCIHLVWRLIPRLWKQIVVYTLCTLKASHTRSVCIMVMTITP